MSTSYKRGNGSSEPAQEMEIYAIEPVVTNPNNTETFRPKSDSYPAVPPAGIYHFVATAASENQSSGRYYSHLRGIVGPYVGVLGYDINSSSSVDGGVSLYSEAYVECDGVQVPHIVGMGLGYLMTVSASLVRVR
ncbi:MAG: hypothetical protein RPT25_13960 [Cycloclasticus sp.]|jgi:hypothetical protein